MPDKAKKVPRKRGLYMAVPKISRNAIRTIMKRLKERNPNLFKTDLSPEGAIQVVTTMWLYGYGQSLESLKQ